MTIAYSRFCSTVLISATVLSVSTLSQAQPLSWIDPQIPSALAPFDGQASRLASLADNDIVIFQHPRQHTSTPTERGIRRYQNVSFNSSALVVSARPAEVRQLLSDYAHYVGLFPTLTHAKPLQTQGNISQVQYRIQVPVPIPLLSFDEKIILQHQLSDHALSTLIVDSPIQYGLGKFEWFPLANSKTGTPQTLVTLTQWGDLNAPKGFIVTTLLKALPEVKLGIPNGVGAFVLESIRRRYDPDPSLGTVYPVQQIIPQHALSTIQTQQVKQLIQRSGGQSVVFAHRPVWLHTPKRAEKLFFSTSYAKINATPNMVFTTLSQPSRYQKLFRQIKKVELIPQADGATDVNIRVGLGLGVITIPYQIKLRTQQLNPTTAVYQANGGDIEFMHGRLHAQPWDQHSSLVSMTSGGKLGDDAPFLLSIGKSLPYADMLPSIGAAPIFIERANRYFQQENSRNTP